MNAQPQPVPATDNSIRINGFAQVVDLLKTADPQFRASLLQRIAARDYHLAFNLQRDLKRDLL